MAPRRKLVSLAIAMLLLVTTAGCGVFGGKTGTLSMYLVDKPVNDLQEVNVTITAVQVQRDDRWETLNSFADGFSVNLLDLRFDEALLGTASLPVGAYRQIRLIIDDSKSNVVDMDGNTTDLKVPSGEQTGLKISHNFTVTGSNQVELLLDVNVVDFVHLKGTGEYQMNPTAIRVVSRNGTGVVSGWVLSKVGETNPPIADRDVVVSLWQDADNNGVADEEIAAAQTVALRVDDGAYLAGQFRLNGVEPGTYILTAEASGYTKASIPGVLVQAGINTTVDGDATKPGLDDPISLTPVTAQPGTATN